ncbi:MAG TPA: extracellular solute-binding protein [Limnochordia bacterium]
MPGLTQARFPQRRLGAGYVYAVFVLALAVVGSGWAQAATTISVMVPDVQEAGRAYYTDTLVPAFESETGIEVDLQLTTWGGYMDRLMTLFVAGEAPDVVQVGGEALGTLIGNGVLQPLDPWARGWRGLNDFPRTALIDGTVEGRLYTIPYRLDERPLLYRKDFFADVGLDPAKPPTDWDSLLDAARKLVRYNADGAIERAGFNTEPAGDLATIFIRQNGGRLVDSERQRAAFASPEAVGGIQFLADMVLSARVGLPTGSPWEGADPIVTGRAAMEYHGDWTLGMMAQYDPSNPDAVGVAIPAGRVTKSGFLYVNKWAMTKTSRNPDAAWQWIEYVSRPEVLRALSRANSFLPARRGAVTGPPYDEDARWGVILEAVEHTIPLPGNVFNLGGVMSELSKAVTKVLNGEQDPRTALTEAVPRADALISGR